MSAPLNLDVFFHLCAKDPHLPYKLAMPYIVLKQRAISLDGYSYNKTHKFINTESTAPFTRFNKKTFNTKASHTLTVQTGNNNMWRGFNTLEYAEGAANLKDFKRTNMWIHPQNLLP